MNQRTEPLLAPPVRLSFAMWGLAACFYLLDFFQRVSPAALALDLSREIANSAVALGSLSSAYFITYAGCQLPGGLLIDRYGSRKVLTGAALLGMTGALVFSQAHTAGSAAIGRLIIGAAGAVAWVGMLKLASHWFSPKRFAGITGLSLAVGGLGGVLSGLPLRLLSDAFGWREVIVGSALVALILALTLYWWLRDEPEQMGYANYAHPAPQSDQPLKRPWRDLSLLCLGQVGVTGSMAAMAWLWSVPYLTSQFSLPPATATIYSSLMIVGFSAGGVFFGQYSDRIERRKQPLLIGSTLTALGFGILATGVLQVSLYATVAVLWLLSFAAGSMVLSFVFAKDLVHGQRTGTIVALVNLSVMVGSIGLPPVFGAILDAFWTGQMEAGVRQYPAQAYSWAFAFLGGWIAMTLVFQSLVHEPKRHSHRIVDANQSGR